jgi:hypothetical protein
LKELSKIPDPRQPKKVKHKLTVVLLDGVLSFVLPMASRREANRELSRPAFTPTLQALEETPVELLRRWIRTKRFRRSLISQCYPSTLDGTQKSSSAAVSGGVKRG